VNLRGFRRVTSSLYVYSYGNLVTREEGRAIHLAVWKAVVDGEKLEAEFFRRADAESAVLERLEER
jgi:hypothetical protein